MMKAFTCVMMVTLMACNSNPVVRENLADTAVKEEMKIQIPDNACYAYTKNGDSIWLKVEVFPNVATGVLIYQISGKDKNAGTFDGRLYGDTLVADYTFRSEGKTSVRQIVFRLSAGQAEEAYGTMKDYEGKMVYENLLAVDFSKGLRLDSISCIAADQRFRTAY